MEFHALWAQAGGASGDSLQLSPSGLAPYSTRFLAEADGWGYFRFNWLKFRLLPTTSSTGLAAGFVPVQDTLPNTVASIMELLDSYFFVGVQTVPSEWVSVSKSGLSGLLPWYKAVNGSFDVTEETPGYLVSKIQTSVGQNIELRFSVTFKEQVAAAQTPEELELVRLRHGLRAKQLQDKEKRKVLEALAPRDTRMPGAPLTDPQKVAQKVPGAQFVPAAVSRDVTSGTPPSDPPFSVTSAQIAAGF